MKPPVPSDLEKTYPQRGPLQLFRFAAPTTFQCFRCGAAKKSKLVAAHRGDWSKELCNACYGRLLSLYEIKAGTASDNDRAESLAQLLITLISREAQRQAERVFLVATERATHLQPESLKFISTSDAVARTLSADANLEWSPAVIGLCKAMELETCARLLHPVVDACRALDLSADVNDKDLGRVAAYCAGKQVKAPELGSIAHFLQTVGNSEARRQSSGLIRSFLRVATGWPGAQWILNPNGLHAGLAALTSRFRNRAAHTEEMSRGDYDACRHFVVGENGLIWRLLLSTVTNL